MKWIKNIVMQAIREEANFIAKSHVNLVTETIKIINAEYNIIDSENRTLKNRCQQLVEYGDKLYDENKHLKVINQTLSREVNTVTSLRMIIAGLEEEIRKLNSILT